MRWPWQRQLVEEGLRELLARMTEVEQQLTKVARLQYKGAQDTLDTVHELATRLSEYETERNRVEAERIRAAVDRDHLIARLLTWLDSLDALGRPLASDDAAWQSTWRADLVAQLADLGLEEVDVVGHPFDPALAESLSAVPPDDPLAVQFGDGRAPYLVVQVLRRGFMKDGRIYRKAHVVTIRGA